MKNIPLYTALACGLGSLSAVQAQERPNIIVFLVDDMGLMDTSVPFLTDDAGQPKAYPLNDWYHTPHMERLAAQGIRFTTFYAQSVSSPSRTSLMTGQNAARHRTTNWINTESNNVTPYGPPAWNWEGLKSATPLYPKVLQQAGYRTIHVGKAHFGCGGSEAEDPCKLGFDVNIAGSSIGEPGSYLGQHGYGLIKGYRPRAVPGLEKYHGTDTFLTEALTQEAIAAVRASVAEGQPFYLNMSHYAVHMPFEKDPRFYARYANRGQREDECAFSTLIEGMDQSLGDLMDSLEEMGIARETLILFLGDNGSAAPLGGPDDYGSSAPLRGKKGAAYEGGVRVPFIAAWAHPDADHPMQQQYPIATGAVQSQPATIMDIYPTVLSVAGIAAPQGHTLDGADLKKLLTGRRDKRHRDDFLMHFPHEHNHSYFTTYRKGDWKLIYYYNPEQPEQPRYELYNLERDPFETQNLAQQEPRHLKQLIRAMKVQLEREGALYPVDKQGQEIHPRLQTD